MLHFDLSRFFDLDLALITYSLFLQKVHAQFFDNFEQKKNLKNSKLLDIKYYINREKEAVFSSFDKKLNLILFAGKTDDNKVELYKSLALKICDNFQLNYIEISTIFMKLSNLFHESYQLFL